MKPLLVSLGVIGLLAWSWYCRFTYTITQAGGTLPVLYVVRVDHWTGITYVAWMMADRTEPSWHSITEK